MMKKLRYAFTVALTLAIMVCQNPMLAQEATNPKQALPADKLAADKARCKLGCGQSGQPDDVCELVCQCTVDKFKQGLDYPRYMALLAEIEQRNVSIENQIFLSEVGNACNAELDQKIPERITRLPKPKKKN